MATNNYMDYSNATAVLRPYANAIKGRALDFEEVEYEDWLTMTDQEKNGHNWKILHVPDPDEPVVGVFYTTPVSCLTGDTTCTIVDEHILATSIIDDYSENSSGTKINVPIIDIATGQAVLHFDALSEDTDFMLRITNL